MSHLGLTPQSVNTMGYRVQGRGDEAAHQLLRDAKAAQDAGAFAVVLELVPAELAAEVTRSPAHPDRRHRRGPGHRRAGAGLDRHGRADRRQDAALRQAVRRTCARSLGDAAKAFADDVVGGTFPQEEHTFH